MMQPQYTAQGRTERLIATGRVVLAASSLLAIWLDPAQPEKYAAVTYALMAVYVVYSVGLAGLVWSARVPRLLNPFASHVLDLVAFSLFIFLTEGPPTSPFFVYFIFSIICATLRWGWRATLWTSLFSLAVFLGMGLVGGSVLDDERLNRFIIRSVYLSVVATMLGYLGAYEQQLRREVAKLAGWPRRSPSEARDVLTEALEYAAEVMTAPRVLMVWEESEEPWVHRVCWSSDLAWEREAPGAIEPVVASAIAERPFSCLDAPALSLPRSSSRRRTGVSDPGQVRPCTRRLQERVRVRAVVGVPLKGDALHGWLFFLDRRPMTADDMVVGEIVAQQVTSRLEHFYLLQRLQQSAVMEERVRLARDLHDGLLQSLAGTALQLHALRRTLGEQPARGPRPPAGAAEPDRRRAAAAAVVHPRVATGPAAAVRGRGHPRRLAPQSRASHRAPLGPAGRSRGERARSWRGRAAGLRHLAHRARGAGQRRAARRRVLGAGSRSARARTRSRSSWPTMAGASASRGATTCRR